MLKRTDLSLNDRELASLMRERFAWTEEDQKALQTLRDLAVLFELDHQVRNGGFAQYFFNKSCLNSFDAWFAADTIDHRTADLLDLAFARLGDELAIDLDFPKLVKAGGQALGVSYAELLGAYERAHLVSPDLLTAFAAFRDRLAPDRGGRAGFDALNRRFYAETDLPRKIVAYVREDPEPFLE